MSVMKKKAALAVVVLGIIAAILVFLYAQQGGHRPKIIREGDAAPDFRLQALDGRSVSLSELRGKVVLLHFWATWCPPCVEEIPSLDRLYRSQLRDGLAVLAVSVDEGGASAVKAFLERNGLTLPVLLNPDRSVAAGYGTFKFPETYLVDRNGIVQYKIIGAANWDNPAAVKVIKDLLAKQ
jgi:peroxiredoxin